MTQAIATKFNDVGLSKTYHYLWDGKEPVASGDFVLVPVRDTSVWNFRVALVIDFIPEFELNPKIPYKFAVQRIDLNRFRENLS